MTKPESTGYDYDVVIGGAGLVGSAAAILLARRGARVALLERRSDPEAYKVLCTHSLTANAHPVLDELGLVPALEKAGAVRNEARWYTRWGWIEPRAAPAGPELPYAYNIRRSTLDPLIRSRAAETPGVDLLLGHQVTGLVRESGRTVGVRASTPRGAREIRARLVVGAERVSKIIGTVDYPLQSRRPTAPGVALVGDAALTGDPLWGVGCGWALQSARWLAEAVAPAATGRGDLDRSLATYAREHRRRLRGHQYLAADFARARPFNPVERLLFSAARDASMARHMYLFASRLIGPLRFLNPVALAKASVVSLRHRGAVPPAHLPPTTP